MEIFAELRAAVLDYNDWPTAKNHARVFDLTRRFVAAVDQRAAVIEHMRQHITPSEQALSELLGEAEK